jgi:hypothetical protein
VNHRERDDNVSTGKWQQADPAGYIDGSNRYQAVRSAPTINLDPSGLKKKGVLDLDWEFTIDYQPVKVDVDFMPDGLKGNLGDLSLSFYAPTITISMDAADFSAYIAPHWDIDLDDKKFDPNGIKGGFKIGNIGGIGVSFEGRYNWGGDRSSNGAWIMFNLYAQ